VALTETLRLLIDADTRGAVQGVERLGSTTQRELSKSQQSLDSWASGLTKAGVGMIGFGSAALFGLGKAAQASEDANLATIKLQNSIRNSPQLAGESSKQFTDLAASIQDVTAADGDQIVAGQAMLGTFRLTADQIKELTPLVVDYSRKFGVDMVSAATQVGKAIDGNVQALKRNGVSIDEAAFATDHYGAVQKALATQVGGFALEEGKTFAGSLQRLKNEMGDLAEGVGGGAVDAFTTLFGAVEGVTNKLEEFSPGAQNAIGKIAAFGSVGLIGAGALSFIAGQALQARTNIVEAAGAVSNLTGKLGGLKAIGATLGIAAAIGAVSVELAKLDDAASNRRFDEIFGFDKLIASLRGSGEEADRQVERFVVLTDHFDMLNEAVTQVADTSPKLARELITAAEAAGLSDEKVKELRETLSNHKAAADAAAEGQSELGGAMSDSADATDDATAALQELQDELAAQFDPIFGMVQALDGQRDAQLRVAEAKGKLDEALASGDAAAAADAQRDYSDALFDASGSLVDVQSAQLVLNDAVRKNPALLDDAKASLTQWALASGYTAEQAAAMAAQLDEAAASAESIPPGKNIVLSITGAEDSRLAIVKVQDALGNVTDKTVTLHVNAAIGQQAINIMSNKLLTGAKGLVVPGPKGAPQLVLAHGGETIVPTHDKAAMASFTPMPVSATGGGDSGRTMVVHIGQVVANDPVTLVEQLKRYERVNGTGWRN